MQTTGIIGVIGYWDAKTTNDSPFTHGMNVETFQAELFSTRQLHISLTSVLDIFTPALAYGPKC